MINLFYKITGDSYWRLMEFSTVEELNMFLVVQTPVATKIFTEEKRLKVELEYMPMPCPAPMKSVSKW